MISAHIWHIFYADFTLFFLIFFLSVASHTPEYNPGSWLSWINVFSDCALRVKETHMYINIEWWGQAPWQQNFVDACFLLFHMFPTIWSCTTTIGLAEFYIRVCLKVTYVWRKIQEAQSNYLLCTARLLMRLDTPLHGNNARGAKYVVYYASIVTHTVFENIKWLRSALCRNWNVAVPSLACLFPGGEGGYLTETLNMAIIPSYTIIGPVWMIIRHVITCVPRSFAKHCSYPEHFFGFWEILGLPTR